MSVGVIAKPTVNSITTIPENPKPLSTVTIIADISGENISRVNLTISECDENACYINQKVDMVLNPDGKYQAEITLKDSENRADHLQYLFKIALENGSEYPLSDNSWKTYLDLSSNDNKNNNEDDTGSDDTPGFEILFVMIAIFIGLLYYKKKR
jgi:hypothetical protein